MGRKEQATTAALRHRPLRPPVCEFPICGGIGQA